MHPRNRAPLHLRAGIQFLTEDCRSAEINAPFFDGILSAER
jgi:hypothetical protein